MMRFNVPATGRASFGIYNTREEADALVAALSVEDQERVLAAQARMRLKAVERLQERREAEQRAHRERLEAAELDDVVASMRLHRQGRA